jgi:hypothetical protein
VTCGTSTDHCCKRTQHRPMFGVRIHTEPDNVALLGRLVEPRCIKNEEVTVTEHSPGTTLRGNPFRTPPTTRHVRP